MGSKHQEKPIPNHGFDSVAQEIKLLNIEGAVIEIGGFRKIASIAETVNTHLKYFQKYAEIYPSLSETVSTVEFNQDIPEKINSVIDRFGEMKDDASTLLQNLRRSINSVKGQINSSFASALSTYNSYGYLDDIRESVVENVRVLAVKAMYRRKVKGGIMGNSKTGSIVYIQPETTYQYTRELNNLEYEEKEEIKRILKELTEFMRPYREHLIEYQELLSDIDVIAAKSKFAEKINGVLPKVSKDRELHLQEAYHPLLYLNNKRKGEKNFSAVYRTES